MQHFTRATILALFACCLVAAQPALDQSQSSGVPTEVSTLKPTTPAPSTTTPAPSTTTPAPSTTTANPATCMANAKEPDVSAQDFSFGDCISAKFGAYFKIDDKSYLDLGKGTVNQKGSFCEGKDPKTPDESRLMINFACGNLIFAIQKNNETVFVPVFTGDYKSGQQKDNFIYNTKLFEVKSDQYYKCDAKQALVVESSLDKNKNYTLFVQNLALEAFKTKKGSDFSKVPQTCSMDAQSTSTWWIYVLVILAIIVAAYVVVRLVSRRDSASSSY